MDHPLNLAHQQSRRVDTMLKAKKYDEAVISSKKAAEHLLEAMTESTCLEAQDSLRLQHAYHLRTAERLQLQQMQVERLQAVSVRAERVMSRGTQTTWELSHPPSMVNSAIFGATQNLDSLLPPFLHAQQKQLQQSESAVTQGQTSSSTPSYTKLPPSDKLLIEELSMHNDDLKRQVYMLLRENEKLRSENMELKHENTTLRSRRDAADQEGHFSLPLFPPLDLPPLEFPEIPDMEVFLPSTDPKTSGSE